jgi:hypothetical protein
MSSVRHESTRCHKSAADWPSTPEIDGITWETGPDPDDLLWAAENLNDDEFVPDEVLDLLADEAAALDRLERGLRPD